MGQAEALTVALHLHAHARRHRVHHPDHRAAGAAHRHLRRAGKRKGVGGPHGYSVTSSARSSRWRVLVAWIYGLLWVLDRRQWWRRPSACSPAFGVIQLAHLAGVRRASSIFSAFDQGLLFQACHHGHGRPGPEPDLRLQRPVQPRPSGASTASAPTARRTSPIAG